MDRSLDQGQWIGFSSTAADEVKAGLMEGMGEGIVMFPTAFALDAPGGLESSSPGSGAKP